MAKGYYDEVFVLDESVTKGDIDPTLIEKGLSMYASMVVYPAGTIFVRRDGQWFIAKMGIKPITPKINTGRGRFAFWKGKGNG